MFCVLCKCCALKVVHEPNQSGQKEFLSSSNMPVIQNSAFPLHWNFNLWVQISWPLWHFMHSYLLDKAFQQWPLKQQAFVEALLPRLVAEMPLTGCTCTLLAKATSRARAAACWPLSHSALCCWLEGLRRTALSWNFGSEVIKWPRHINGACKLCSFSFSKWLEFKVLWQCFMGSL